MVTLYEQQVNMNCQVFMLHSWLIVVNTPSPPPRICSSSFSSIGFVNFKISSLIVFPPYEQHVKMNCQVFMLHSWLIVVNTPSPPPRICSSSFSSIGFVNFKISSLIVYSSLKYISCPNKIM